MGTYNNYNANNRRFAPQENEYPWHTPPRFQRMRQQQRMEKQQQKQRAQRLNTNNSMNPKNNSWVNKVDKKRESGPLYLRNSAIPAPPNKCPPPPPGPPGPFAVSHSVKTPKTVKKVRSVITPKTPQTR